MKKILKIVLILLFVGFIVMQFFQIDKTNPPINPAESIESTIQIPENVQAIFKRSCDDCHSHKTVYPFYSYISPISWNVADHIRIGRNRLNFSVWNTYDARKKRKKLDEICEEIESGSMPMNQYLWIHWDAKLNETDKKVICDWTKAETEKIKE